MINAGCGGAGVIWGGDPAMTVRRRLFVGGVLVVVLVLVGVVTAVRVSHGRRHGVGRAAAPQDRPGPVLLVPGYGGGTAGLERLATRVRGTGREVAVVRLPGDATGDLNRQADVLDRTARAALRGGASSVDVVGFSAGGVVARLWAADDGGAQVARRIVTLGSPHHGTELAAVAAVLSPDSCPRACQELIPGSDLLVSLNRGDETPSGPRWVSIWTAQDQVVTPPDSARLAGARNIVVQRVCAGRAVAHGELPTDAVVGALVLRALAVAPPATPRPAECAALAATD